MRRVWSPSQEHRRIRDFAKKSYRNPFYAEKKSDWKNTYKDKRALWLVGALFIGLIAVGLGFILRGQQFSITEVVITGASPSTESVLRDIITREEQQNRAFLFPQKNIFFFDNPRTENKIRAQFYFDTLAIRKKIPHTLVIEVKEKPVQAIFLQQNQFLGIDRSGFVIRDLDENELKSLVMIPNEYMTVLNDRLGIQSVATSESKSPKNPYPVIVDDVRDLTIAPTLKKRPGNNVLSPAMLTVILQAYDKLQNVTGSPTQWFWIKERSETIVASIFGGWSVYMTSSTSYELQSQRLGVVLKEKLSTQKGSIDYIDLRYDERVFYKLKTSSGANTPPTKEKP